MASRFGRLLRLLSDTAMDCLHIASSTWLFMMIKPQQEKNCCPSSA
jgi:hypothetical protein